MNLLLEPLFDATRQVDYLSDGEEYIDLPPIHVCKPDIAGLDVDRVCAFPVGSVGCCGKLFDSESCPDDWCSCDFCGGFYCALHEKIAHCVKCEFFACEACTPHLTCLECGMSVCCDCFESWATENRKKDADYCTCKNAFFGGKVCAKMLCHSCYDAFQETYSTTGRGNLVLCSGLNEGSLRLFRCNLPFCKSCVQKECGGERKGTRFFCSSCCEKTK